MTVIIEPNCNNTKHIQYLYTDYIISRIGLSNKLSCKDDISSIRLETVPHNLREVHLLLGLQRVASIYTILPGQNLLKQFLCNPKDIFPVSKSNCMTLHIDFCFENDKSDSTDPDTYWIQEQEKSKRVLSEDDVEIYDENEDVFIRGKQVIGYTTEIIKHLCFKPPIITIETSENDSDVFENRKPYALNVWQRCTFMKSVYSEEILERYKSNYELRIKEESECNVDSSRFPGENRREMENGRDIIEEFRSLDSKGQLDGILVNKIAFSHGLANLAYHF